MIAVAGGTGRLGSRVVGRLAAAGFAVRVLTRDPARAEHLTKSAAEVVSCDVRDRASMQVALQGARVAVSAVHGFAGPGRVSPQSVDRDGNTNLVDAAADVGADVVMLSVVGASAKHPMELFRAKHVAEAHLRASGVEWSGRSCRRRHSSSCGAERKCATSPARYSGLSLRWAASRAALAMDTIDMTFDMAAANQALVELPMTDIQVALTRAAS